MAVFASQGDVSAERPEGASTGFSALRGPRTLRRATFGRAKAAHSGIEAANTPAPGEFPVRSWPERRVVVLVSAALLLTGVFAASTVSANALHEFAVLYVLSVVLVGLELGVRGGIGAAALAFVLLVAASGSDSALGAPGLTAFGTVFVAVGAVAGRFSTRMREGHRREERLLLSGLRLARLEDLDALPRVLAEEVKQAVDLSSVEVRLHGARAVQVGIQGGETLRVSISARGIDFGSLTLGAPAGRFFTREDRVVAAKLAQQAAVAADNQRLLVLERERAALHTELEHTRERLVSHLGNVGQILNSQEAERRDIARQLHGQAAQAMSGVLMGLQVLERDLGQELTRQQLEELSSIVRDTLADLRQLAVSVRPPSLDDLGLRAALEGIAEREGERGPRHIALHCDDCPNDLAPEVETCAYRLVEEGIQALAGSLEVRLSVEHDRGRLRIELRSHQAAEDEQLLAKLATPRARVELIGGTLQTSSNGTRTTGILAEIPLRVARDSPEPAERHGHTRDRQEIEPLVSAVT